jgi:hypothetical protein
MASAANDGANLLGWLRLRGFEIAITPCEQLLFDPPMAAA